MRNSSDLSGRSPSETWPTLSFERIHEIGAKRHPCAWFTANHAAVNAMADWIGPVDRQELKRIISLTVLRVLDRVMDPVAERPDNSAMKPDSCVAKESALNQAEERK